MAAAADLRAVLADARENRGDWLAALEAIADDLENPPHPDNGDEFPAASLANMRHAASLPDAAAVVAWDAETGETCSANPNDYFYLRPLDVLQIDGRPMYLVRAEVTRRIVPAF